MVDVCSWIIAGVHYGLGKHVLAVEQDDPNLPSNIVNVFKVPACARPPGLERFPLLKFFPLDGLLDIDSMDPTAVLCQAFSSTLLPSGLHYASTTSENCALVRWGLHHSVDHCYVSSIHCPVYSYPFLLGSRLFTCRITATRERYMPSISITSSCAGDLQYSLRLSDIGSPWLGFMAFEDASIAKNSSVPSLLTRCIVSRLYFDM